VRKFDINSLYICPPHLYTVAILPCEIQKVIFQQYFHTYFRLFMLSQKKTNVYPLTTTPENVTALPCKMQNFFFWLNVAFHNAVLKCSSCRNKTLQQLVRVADWYSIHALLQYPNSAVPTSSSLSLEQHSTGSITETCCWCRSCYQRSAALLETCLSSSKTMRQHIMLVTQSSFSAVRHPSSSVLTCGQPTVLASTR